MPQSAVAQPDPPPRPTPDVLGRDGLPVRRLPGAGVAALGRDLRSGTVIAVNNKTEICGYVRPAEPRTPTHRAEIPF